MGRTGRAPTVWRLAARVLPREFRRRHADEMAALLADELQGAGPVTRARILTGATLDVLRRGLALRAAGLRRTWTRGGWTMTGGLWQDLVFGVRALARRPGFTLVAVFTLALGIGANTTIFSVVNGVLLRPLPYRAADRIGLLWHEFGDGAQNLPALHPLDLYDYRARSQVFEDFTLASGREWILGGADDPEVVDVGAVEAGFFDFFGVAPVLGRTFTAQEDQPGAAWVVILSHRIWERRFGADPSIIGRLIPVAGTSMEVVGVLPEGFHLQLPGEAFLLRDAEIWTPLRIDPARLPPRNFTGFTGFGRIRQGATFAQAQEELDAMASQLRAENPVHAASKLEARVVPLLDDVVKGARQTLMLLFGAVGFVLLIACANVANLVTVRGQVRSAELDLRAALGAGRWGLVRLVLVESALLAGLGAVFGVALSAGGLELLARLGAGSVPRLENVGIDLRVLSFAVAAAGTSALVFGLAPGLRAARRDPGATLHGFSRGGEDRASRRLRNGLVVAEIAASLVLLVGTALMIQSFRELTRVNPGYALDGRLTFRLSLPVAGFPDGAARDAFRQQLRDDLEGLPTVTRVAAVSQLPLTGSGPLQPYAYDEETASNWESVTADRRFITPSFFDAMGARLVAGREFTTADAAAGDRIIIDDRLARTAFGDVDAVGRRLQVNPDDAPENIRYAQVVGVVEHLRLHDLSRPVLTQIYFPLSGSARFSVVVRSSGDPAALTPSVRAVVKRLAPGTPIEDLVTLRDLARESLAPTRLALTLMTFFGVAALVLASVGIYGVLSFVVSRRVREIGVRMALGQAPGDVRRHVLGQGLRLVLLAVTLGLLAAAALSGATRGLLFGVDPLDPWIYAATAGLLAAVAMAACWLPAARATRIDPATALRE